MSELPTIRPDSRPIPKEHPIIFSGPMVRAILEGRKSQTRRPVRIGHAEIPLMIDLIATGRTKGSCPYGTVGDLLWVRETTADASGSAFYEADGMDVCIGEASVPWWYSKRICPSTNMPRWASRITLEITDVRVQRVQEISEEDAKAEGVERSMLGDTPIYCDYGPKGQAVASVCKTARYSFETLWDSINRKHAPWSSNPWVWCLSFRRIK
jgi:hypothetical protein